MLVRAVHGAADLRRFIDLPYRLHRGDPTWVAPLRMDVRAILDRRRNPFFEHAEAEYYLAERDGAVVGRIAAIRNDAHGAFHPEERHVGFFGFFECVNDQAVADALFGAAAAWLKDRGLTTLRGPTSFSTNDECGLLVDGFDDGKQPAALCTQAFYDAAYAALRTGGADRRRQRPVGRPGDRRAGGRRGDRPGDDRPPRLQRRGAAAPRPRVDDPAARRWAPPGGGAPMSVRPPMTRSGRSEKWPRSIRKYSCSAPMVV